MKILYVFDSQDHEVFKMSDLPPSFEILREGKGKKPIVFKPAATRMQDLQARLDEAEKLLKEIRTYAGWDIVKDSIPNPVTLRFIDEYFDRQ